MSGNRKKPIGVDLFAGAGGLSLGFEQAGFDVVVAVERDAVHAAVHSYNFPKCVVLNKDVCDVNIDSLRRSISEGLEACGRASEAKGRVTVDVVIGGAPWQGFSVIGHRDAAEYRNKLVYQFHRIVAELRPKYFVMENVPGMAVGDQGRILTRLLRRFVDSGY